MAVIDSIDGANTLITLASGVTEIRAIDIYSEWKVWKQTGDNAKYLPAFRTIGGDPLSSIINAGSYFFVRNDYGWRIKPPEEDITIYMTGNLAAEDTSLPVFQATTGDFTAAILGLQPVTQGVTPLMKEQLEYASFGNAIWIDQQNGYSGTGYLSSGHPIGNAEYPVNNIADALTIRSSRGLPRTLMVRGNLILDTGDNISGFRIIGENSKRTHLTINTGANITDVDIQECTVTGTLDGGAIIRTGYVYDLTYFDGFIFQCQLSGTITLGNNTQANILSCYAGVAGSSEPTIDFGGSGQGLILAAYSGGVVFTNKTGTDSADVGFNSGGQVRINTTTVTNGKITVRGNGSVVDNADPDDHLLSGTYGSLTLYNDTTTGQMLQELWQLQGLDPDNAMTVTPTTRSVGNISQSISGDGTSTTTVTRT